MKVFLMHRDRDMDDPKTTPWNADAVEQDLALTTLIDTMADGDEFLAKVSRGVLLTGLRDPEAIRYRQNILRDFLSHPEILDGLFSIAAEAVVGRKRHFLSRMYREPETVLHRSLLDLANYVDLLPRLRAIAEERADDVESEGLRRFFRMLREELDDAYFEEIRDHLVRLDLRNAVNMSAALGSNLTGDRYVLHEPAIRPFRFMAWITRRAPRSYVFRVTSADDRWLHGLTLLRGRGVALVSDAVARSCEHIFEFFSALRTELAFYVACGNLSEHLEAADLPTCYPVPTDTPATLVCDGLYDACLACSTDDPVVGNDVDARATDLIVVTGANHGGKSTFLRSLGVAQLMTQAGMFAPARALEVTPTDGVYTHFRREEDATMTSGKLDEELARMSEILDHLEPGALVLCNESFSSTNEHEGSHVAREIVLGLIEAGVRVVFVTHMYELAHGLYSDARPGSLFLRAPREDDGRRTFRLAVGEPLSTSYGSDLFERVLGEAARA